MKDEAAPIPVQFTITLTALVYPEPEAGGYSAEVPACRAAIPRAKPWRRSRPTSAKPPRDGWSPRITKPWTGTPPRRGLREASLR